MNSFEKALARFREEKEQQIKRKEHMNTNLEAVLKRVKQAIDKEKDPDRLLKLSAQYVKLNAQKRKRGPQATSPSKQNHSLRDVYKGSQFDDMPEGKLVLHHLMVKIESERRRLQRHLTATENDALYKELLDSLSEDERAAYEVFEAENLVSR